MEGNVMPDVLKITFQLLLLMVPFMVLFLLLRWAKPHGRWYQAGVAIALMVSLSLLVRFEPLGMSHVMLLMVMAQVLVAIYVLFTGVHVKHQTPARAIVALTAIMSVLWSVSAWLFHKSLSVHLNK